MSDQPWETHDRLCPNRRPTVAFPNSACSGCRAVVAARAEGYTRGRADAARDVAALEPESYACECRCAPYSMRSAAVAAARGGTDDD